MPILWFCPVLFAVKLLLVIAHFLAHHVPVVVLSTSILVLFISSNIFVLAKCFYWSFHAAITTDARLAASFIADFAQTCPFLYYFWPPFQCCCFKREFITKIHKRSSWQSCYSALRSLQKYCQVSGELSQKNKKVIVIQESVEAAMILWYAQRKSGIHWWIHVGIYRMGEVKGRRFPCILIAHVGLSSSL